MYVNNVYYYLKKNQVYYCICYILISILKYLIMISYNFTLDLNYCTDLTPQIFYKLNLNKNGNS